MGERTYIYLVSDGIYLYSHWNTAGEMLEVVKQALIRGKDRWYDSSYCQLNHSLPLSQWLNRLFVN